MAKSTKAKRIISFGLNLDAIALLKINLALNDCHDVNTWCLYVGLSSDDHKISKVQTFACNLGSMRFAAYEIAGSPPWLNTRSSPVSRWGR